jgi:hypothetical protein
VSVEYWKECISIAADECGLALAPEQLHFLAEAVESGHENYGMAFGHDCIPDPVESEAHRELQKLRAENERHEQWKNSTKPCKICTTTGSVRDGWGRDITCPNCNGSGRI